MGLKIGFAALAVTLGVYVRVNLNEGKPFPLAEVMFIDGENDPFVLRYPDGSIGTLVFDGNRQLRIGEILPHSWVPTKEQMLAIQDKLPNHRIMFDGSYVIREIPA